MSEFVSYAQNYEDVMLWRALKGIQHGFYVDVGANDPKHCSVTQAFYERGWQGINIEPMGTYYGRLCKERPLDINLPLAVGDKAGELTFYEVPETGLSTMVPKFAQDAQTIGWPVIERKVRVQTLTQILAENSPGQIHVSSQKMGVELR